MLKLTLLNRKLTRFTTLLLPLLFAEACGGAGLSSSPSNKSSGAPVVSSDEEEENLDDKTPSDSMNSQTVSENNGSSDTDTMSPDTDAASSPTEDATAQATVHELPSPMLANAGAQTCQKREPQELGTTNVAMSGLIDKEGSYDVAYGKSGGLAAWPRGDVVQTRALSLEGKISDTVNTVEMPVKYYVFLFPVWDKFLLVTQTRCKKTMTMSSGRLSSFDGYPKTNTIERAAKRSMTCVNMRILDNTGKAVGPVSTFPNPFPFGHITIDPIESRQAVICGGAGKGGPECAILELDENNTISAEHVYSRAVDPRRLRGMVSRYNVIADRNQWLLWIDTELEGEDLGMYRDGKMHHIAKSLLSRLSMQDALFTDDGLQVVAGDGYLHSQGSRYKLSTFSYENGKRINENVKMKPGQTIPAPFDQKVYYNVWVSPKGNTHFGPLRFRRHNILSDNVGEDVELLERFHENHPIESAFSGRVFSVVYPEKTTREAYKWTLHIQNLNCSP